MNSHPLQRVRPVRFCLLLVAALSPTYGAQAEDWEALMACSRKHLSAVEQAEPSLHDGARLIVDVLCTKEAAELGNQMAKSRPSNVEQNGSYGRAFESFLAVMRTTS